MGKECIWGLVQKRPQHLDINGWIILKWILEEYDGTVNWIHLAEHRDQWQALVNTIMNL
jgi:hypothetical protein